MATNVITNRTWIKRLSLMAVCVILMMVSFWLFRYFYFNQTMIKPIPIPSSIATGASMTELNPQGQLLHRFFSDKVYNYDQAQRSTFTNPVGYYYQPQQPVWKMRADTAVSLKNHQIIHFNGHVYIHQAAGKNNSAITLTTEQMTVLPPKKVAYNNVKTEANESGLNVTAIGFHADMKTNEVKLLSKTEAKYTQTKRSQ